MPDAGDRDRTVGDGPFRSYQRDSGSALLPDPGGMFHVKHSRTAPIAIPI